MKSNHIRVHGSWNVCVWDNFKPRLSFLCKNKMFAPFASITLVTVLATSKLFAKQLFRLRWDVSEMTLLGMLGKLPVV
eukprot:1617401-Amphidinium_carterae.1